MSAKPTKRRRGRGEPFWAGHADLDRLGKMSDEEIERTSPPELKNLPADFWDDAVLTEPLFKQQISLRVDLGVLEWFKDQGPRYQTRMNEVLRSYMYRMKQLERERLDGAERSAPAKPAKPTKKARATPYDTAAPKGARKPSRRAPRGG